MADNNELLAVINSVIAEGEKKQSVPQYVPHSENKEVIVEATPQVLPPLPAALPPVDSQLNAMINPFFPI
jgi:hypothetical protein